MLSYTPAVGEKGVIRWDHSYDWSGGIFASVSVVQVWIDGGTNTFGKYYAYHKTDATTITLTLLDDTQSWTQPQEGSPTGPVNMTITGTPAMINNAGTIESSGSYAGPSFNNVSPPDINYGGYNEAGTWDADFTWNEGALSIVTDRFWVNDDADEDSDNPNNWAAISGGTGGAGVPTSADKVYFDTNSGSNNCTLSDDLDCFSLSADANYSGNFDKNQFDIICHSGTFVYDGTGNLTVDGGLLKVNGTIHIGSNVGTYNQNGLDLQYTADGDLDIDKSGSSTNAIKTILLDTNVTVNTTSAVDIKNDGATSITINNGAVFQLQAMRVKIYSNGTCTPILVVSGGALNGSTGWLIEWRQSSAGALITLPPVESHLAFSILASANAVYNASGGSMSDVTIRPASPAVTDLTLNFGTEDLTFASNITVISKWSGTANAVTVNFGSGTVECDTIVVNNAVGSSMALNLQSATIKTSGDLDFSHDGAFSVDPGTSTVVFNGTANQDVTLGGESFYDVTLNNIGGGVTLQGDFSCNTFLNTNGDFDKNGHDIVSASDWLFQSADIVTFDGLFTMTGDGTFQIGSSLSGYDFSSSTLVFNGDTVFNVGVVGAQFNVIKGGADGKTLTKSDSNTVYLEQFENLHSNGVISWSGTVVVGGANPWVNNIGIWESSGTAIVDPSTAGTVTFKCDRTIDTNVEIKNSSGGDAVVNQTDGQLTCKQFKIFPSSNASLTYNTNDHNITAYLYSIRIQNQQSASSLVFNQGASILSAKQDFSILSQVSTTVNMGAGQAKFERNFSITDNGTLTLDTGTSIVEANGTISQNITFDGVSLNILKVTNTTNPVILLDASACNRWDFDPGSVIKLKDLETHSLASHVSGDIDGIVGDPVTILSTADGSPATFDNPSGMVVSYVSVKDNNANNPIDTSDGTSVDLGNTTNWFINLIAGGYFNQAFNKEFNNSFN